MYGSLWKPPKGYIKPVCYQVHFIKQNQIYMKFKLLSNFQNILEHSDLHMHPSLFQVLLDGILKSKGLKKFWFCLRFVQVSSIFDVDHSEEIRKYELRCQP